MCCITYYIEIINCTGCNILSLFSFIFTKHVIQHKFIETSVVFLLKINCMNLEKSNNIAKLDLFKEISEYTGGMAILTGSIALILQGQLKERECHDIDIILPYYIDLSTYGKITRVENDYTTTCAVIANKLCNIHIIIRPECPYAHADGIKLANVADIWMAKFKSYILFNTDKNKRDLEELFSKNQVPVTTNFIDKTLNFRP